MAQKSEGIISTYCILTQSVEPKKKKKQFRALTAENTPNLSNNPSKGDFTHPTNPTIRP